MVNKTISIRKGGGAVILDLEKYRGLERKIAEYERKEKLLRSLEKFENLAKWGRSFARKKRITLKQVFEND